MRKIVVIYSSKYGATRQYAEWIRDELSCAIQDAKKTDAQDLSSYDTIIFGGGLYAGGISGIHLITDNFEKIKNKKIVVFTVGLADPQKTEQFRPILQKNFSAEMRPFINVFHLRGHMDYHKLNLPHRAMMAMMKSMIQRKGELKSDEDHVFLQTYGKKVDFKDASSIAPILACVNNLEAK